MKKSLLTLYIEKVAEGDVSFVDRLCAQLADRLIYVPIKKEGSAPKSRQVSFEVLKLNEGEKILVPVFTSEHFLTNWCQAQGLDAELISLLGADFCLALGDGSWLLIDPGAGATVELPPDDVRKIATVDAEADTLEEVSSSEIRRPVRVNESGPAQSVEATMAFEEPPIAPAAADKNIPPVIPKKKSFLDFLRNR